MTVGMSSSIVDRYTAMLMIPKGGGWMGADRRPKIDFGLLKRAISKKLTGSIKYRSRAGYDAQRYWSERFNKYGSSLRGAGHEGLSEEANEKMYLEAAGVFQGVVGPILGHLTEPRVLEIGCGTGFYTSLFNQLGLDNYTGVDITNVLFDRHRRRFPRYRFLQADITKHPIDGSYDLAIMIDVIEHIVTRDALEAAFANLRAALAPGGYLIVGPQFDQSRRHLFYVHFWSVEDVKTAYAEWDEVERKAFRNGILLVFQKPKDVDPPPRIA
ncbi:MAG: methyltransferase domain-containing protein [Actinobacteria bacterium]|nr:methyltransferase domain-containing protein [Actinomycetota bacterium]